MAETTGPRGVKRVRQACINCRRKKTRCPGERPACSFCQRLQQLCEYDDDGVVPPVQFNHADVGNLAARIMELESKLNDMSRTTQSNPSGNSDAFVFPSFEQDPDDLGASLLGEYTTTTQITPPSVSFNFEPALSLGDLPKATFDRLIDDYFRYSHNQPYSFFHEEGFRRKLANATLPDFLLEVVVMSALRFSNDPYFDSDMFFTNKRKAIADSLARKAWKQLSSKYVDGEDECSVAVVQAITLLAIYEFVEGRQRGAWVKIGIAAKFAQDLRLMFEPSTSLSTPEQEEWRRAFWSIYLLDRLMTCGRARPPVFADASISLKLPCSEDSFQYGIWEEADEIETYLSDAVLQAPQPSPFARVVIISALLSRCSQYSIQAQRDSKNLPPWDTRSDYTSINASLLYLESHANWQESISDSMKAVTPDGSPYTKSTELIVVSSALYHLCYCMLNHYFLIRQKQSFSSTRFPYSFYSNALQIGLHHAHEFTRILESAVEAGCLVISSFLSYACLLSATVHAVYRHSDFTLIQEQAASDLEFSLTFLEKQAQYWPNASAILNQLHDFCAHSVAYKDLISVSPEVSNVSQTDANRLYALIDYSTISVLKEVAVWPKVPSSPSQ